MKAEASRALQALAGVALVAAFVATGYWPRGGVLVERALVQDREALISQQAAVLQLQKIVLHLSERGDVCFVCSACDGSGRRAWELSSDGPVMGADGEHWLVRTRQDPDKLPCRSCVGRGWVR